MINVAFRTLMLGLVLGSTGIASAQNATPRSGPERRAFDERDQDHSGTLSQAEFLANTVEKNRALRLREFRLCDFDADGVLSWEESLCTAGVLPPGGIRSVPDPVADRAARVFDLLIGKPDTDHVQAMDSIAADVLRQRIEPIEELREIPETHWDRNSDGHVSREELQLSLDIAYGLKLESGQSTRNPDGSLFHWSYFRSLDKNRDGALSPEELEPLVSAADAKKRFAEADTDHDGKLSTAEASLVVRIDTLAQFRQRDRNLDGRVDADELSEPLSPREKSLLPRLLPPFDDDSDGVLSFLEWRLSPMGQFVVDWMRIPNDGDRDGSLSPAEFAPESGLFARALGHLYFAKFDRDRDGRLAYAEQPLVTDMARLPRQVAFETADLNGDGQLNGDELFRHASPAAGNDAAARTHLGRRLVFDAIMTRADADHDAVLSRQEFDASDWGAHALDVGLSGSVRAIPDPLVERVAALTPRLEAAFDGADTDHDGSLSATEWKTLAWNTLPSLRSSPLELWDRNSDRVVSRDEFLVGLSVAFGLQMIDGTPLRDATHIMNLGYFTTMDANQDGQLTRDEFSARYYLGREKSGPRFDEATGGTGSVRFADVRTVLFRNSILDSFLSYDRDRNGLLDAEELVANRPYLKLISERVIPAFDDDGDGRLSFLEFRETPLADESHSWAAGRTDRDGDGQLSVEEFRVTRGLLASALSDLYFDRFDRNQNGTLSLDEFPFATEASPEARTAAFDQADRDTNGTLTREELFQLTVAANADAAARRTFAGRKVLFDIALQQADQDGNDSLSRTEFLSGPWGMEAIQIGKSGSARRVPDPMLDLKERLQTEFSNAVREADGNGDGQLDSQEWRTLDWKRLAPLAETPWTAWDRNQDRQVSIEEIQRGLAVALCRERPDGTSLRDEGSIYNLAYFESLDANHDGNLTRDEFVARYYLGREKSGARFDQLDPDQRGRVTFAEVRRSGFRTSVLDLFLECDRDLNGTVTSEELPLYRPYFKTVTERLIPGFDRDGDGRLSYMEFRGTPLADESANWTGGRTDRDGDGWLSPDEFRPGRDLFASGLSDVFFVGFDRDRDGRLSLAEFPFTTDIANQPREKVFQQADRDGDQVLAHAELFTLTLPENPTPAQRRAATGRTVIYQSVMSRADKNGDGNLSREEFLAGPWGVESLRVGTTGQSRLVPDPVRELSGRLEDRMKSWFAEHDTDSSHSLSGAEWEKLNWTALRPLAPSALMLWDRDEDGSVTREEATRGVRIALSLELPDGLGLRTEQGTISNWAYFEQLDANHDGWLTRDEFRSGHYLGKEKGGERFDQLDPESRGRLTFAEMRDGVFRTSVLDVFLGYDTDFNGLLTRDELLAQRPWLKGVAEWVLPGFDQDGDGMLTFDEFRSTPLADESVSWTAQPQDKDRDGRLTIVEFRPMKSLFGSGLSDLFYLGFDTNRDGNVTYDERPFGTDLAKLPPDQVFRLADLDGNERLTIEELFRQKLPAEPSDSARRSFIAKKLVFDAILPRVDTDNNREVTREEFQASPWGIEASRLGLTGVPGAIPDPVNELADRLVRAGGAGIKTCDRNADDRLNAEEWSGLDWKTLAPLTPMPHVWWDLDSDGDVTIEEWTRGMKIAFSLERVDGTPLRTSGGQIFNVNYFVTLDTDKDGMLSRDEFTKRYHLGPEKSAERFDQLDEAKTGRLSFKELATTTLAVPIVDSFLHLDANLDGRIQRQELISRVHSWQNAWVEHVFPGFDTDGDGALDFLEFRHTPYSDESKFWTHTPDDLDRDGRLTASEFRQGKDLVAAGLSDLFFAGFDRNRDQILSYDELPFSTDLLKLPRDAVFRIADRNGDERLEVAELFPHTLPKAPTPAALRAYRARQLAFASVLGRVDRNDDQVVTLDEFLASEWGVEAVKAGTTGGARLPDPQAELAEQAADAISRRFEHLDSNHNGRLDATEWAALDWTLLSPLAPSPLAWWDANQDQGISLDELRQGFKVAYGMERTDGAAARTANGAVYNLAYFLTLDKNHDEILTVDEFKSGYYLGPEKSAARFAELDPEGKGKSYRELQDALFRGSAIDMFLSLDENLDGVVEANELATRLGSWQRAWADFIIPAFDADANGKLTLMEFRRSPLSDNGVTWTYKPNDVNRDGILTPDEFRPAKSLFASGLADSYFRAFDRNRDGRLSYGEFPFSTDLARLPADVVFQLKDKDRDGSLTFAEVFPDKRPDGTDAGALRSYMYRLIRCEMAFQATDTDRNNQLSKSEFESGRFAGTSLSESAGGPIPDPMDELITKRVDDIYQSRVKLSQAEWTRIAWSAVAPDLTGMDFAKPDDDRDGSITRDEARRVMEVAYGLRLPDGFLVRLSTGHIFNVTYFDGIDTNHDGRLSRSEFVPRFYSGPEASAKLFESSDVNQDGYLDRTEALKFLKDDRLSTFQHFDRDLNGAVTAAELKEFGRAWEQNLVRTLLPTFDLDGNGALSFHEATMSPLLNRVVDWNAPRRDANSDTFLSLDEFGATDSLFASALRRLFYRTYDRDGDGKLSYDEYPFEMDLSKVPAEIALKVRDLNRDGVLKFEEIFTDAKPDSRDQAAQERYEMRLAAAETKFLADDSNHDGGLDVEEYKQSQEATLKAVERKTKALSRHQKKNPSNLPFIAFLVFDALALAGGGWYVFKKFGK